MLWRVYKPIREGRAYHEQPRAPNRRLFPPHPLLPALQHAVEIACNRAFRPPYFDLVSSPSAGHPDPRCRHATLPPCRKLPRHRRQPKGVFPPCLHPLSRPHLFIAPPYQRWLQRPGLSNWYRPHWILLLPPRQFRCTQQPRPQQWLPHLATYHRLRPLRRWMYPGRAAWVCPRLWEQQV